MTVTAATTRNDYVATSGQTVFPYTFTALADGDIKVLKNGTALTLGAGNDYTLSGIGSYGGNVTLNSGAATGDKIAIYLDMDLARTTNYQNSGDFLALDVNGDFDALWLALQQGTTDIERTVRRPDSDAGTINMELPAAASRAKRLLAFDSTGAVTIEPYLNNETIVLNVQTATGDGVTTSYGLLNVPSSTSLLQISIDGLLQEVSSYSLAGSNLVFSEAPPVGAAIEIRAFVQKEITSTDLSVNEFTGNGSTTSFTLSAPAIENNTFVYINGVYQFKSTYSVSGNTITFSTAPPNTSGIEVVSAAFTTTDLPVPGDNTVTTDKIVDGAVTAAKIASAPISVGITTAVTSTSITATVNTHVYVSAAGRTITLPASPTIGQRVLITVGNFTDTVVGRNGSNIMGSATDFTMDAAYLSIQFIFTNATQGWVMS